MSDADSHCHLTLAIGYALLPYQRAFVRMAKALQCYHAAAAAMGVPREDAERILHEERTRGEPRLWCWRTTFDQVIARATRRLYDGQPEPVWIGVDFGRDVTPSEFRRLHEQEWPMEPAQEPRPQDSASLRRHPRRPRQPRPRPL